MKVFWILYVIIMVVSCGGLERGEGFCIDHLTPRSTQFEKTLKVEVHFSKPLNRQRFNPGEIQLLEHNCPDCLRVPISSYSFNDEGDVLIIESENVEPGKYYKIQFGGNIASQENLLLSYHYNGDYIADEIYYIKERRARTPCITINEVLNYPSGSADYEFVELFNCSSEDVDLRGFHIKIDDFKPQRLLFTNGAYLMRPSGYSIILSNIYLPTTQPIIYIEGKFGRNGLSNTDLRRIELLDESGMVVSEFIPFARSRKGISFECINPYERSTLKNWGFSRAREGSTPMKENSIYLEDIFPPEIISYEIADTGLDNITLKFDEEIMCEGVNCIYLLSDKNEKIPGIAELLKDRIRFIPVKPLVYGSRYKVVATAAIKDLNGNNYRDGEIIGEIITPVAPSLMLYYPAGNVISSSTRYLEFVSKTYLLDRSEVYLEGRVQRLKLSCIKGKPAYHYLCTIVDDIEGPEDLCLIVDDKRTDLCITLFSTDISIPPAIKIHLSIQMKDMLYLQVESNLPCLLFADFSYKEDLDEKFSFSTYSFSQRFDYGIKIQDPYKEYLVDIYCLDALNQSTAMARISTTSVTEERDSVIIAEVLTNPAGADTLSEFIEIFNGGDSIIDLSRISIGDCINRPVSISRYSQASLSPGSYALIVSNGSRYFSENRGCATISGADKIIGRDLKNGSTELLCLYYNGYPVDIFNSTLTLNKEGLSIERSDRAVYLDPLNWKISDIPGGTPCK